LMRALCQKYAAPYAGARLQTTLESIHGPRPIPPSPPAPADSSQSRVDRDPSRSRPMGSLTKALTARPESRHCHGGSSADNGPRPAAQAQARPTIGPRPSRPPSPGPHHDSDDDSDPQLRPAASSPACSAAAPSPAPPRLPRFHEVRHEPLKGSDPPGPRAGRCRPIGPRRGRDRRLGGGHGPPRPPPTGPSSPWSNCRRHKIIIASVRLRHY
jgi:hypothetical protein